MQYLKTLFEDINGHLERRGIPLGSVGYALCLRKSIMHVIQVKSRIELLKLIRESNTLNFGNNPRKITVVDEGDEIVWNKLQTNTLRPSSYYVHAHIMNSYIYLKLHQIVDITNDNDKAPESSTLFIKDKYVNIQNIFRQLSDMLWSHIQSLDDMEKQQYVSFIGNSSFESKNYENFTKKFIEFIKNEVKNMCVQVLGRKEIHMFKL